MNEIETALDDLDGLHEAFRALLDTGRANALASNALASNALANNTELGKKLRSSIGLAWYAPSMQS